MGAISALKDCGVPVDVVGGTSIGAVVAAIFALEWNLPELSMSLADEFARVRFTDYAIPSVAVFSKRRFDRTLGRWLGELRIEDAPIPFFCVSTNLTDGRPSLHRAGPFATWLRATTAIPGIFPPVLEHDAVHVDGGVLNNLPTNCMSEFGVSVRIAIDVGSDSGGPWRFRGDHLVQAGGKTNLPSLLELLVRVGTIGSGAAEESMRGQGDVVIRPAVSDIGVFGWRARERAIKAGYQAVLEHLPEIRAAVGPTG